MKKKSETFLFGAGAVIDWNAPSTPELTKSIRGIGFNLIKKDLKITEFIYQRLLTVGYNKNEINFETIINVIEELIVFNSEYNKNPSLLKTFLSDINISEIYNYSIKGGKREYNYQLQIPIGKDYNYSGSAICDENPNQFFLEHLIHEILREISLKVSEYSYDTDGYPVVDKNCQHSLNFRKLMKSINERCSIRLYTLNYDNLFMKLLEKEGINCFDGFESNSINNYSFRPNLKKIISDSTSNIHYNLHGSVYWTVANLDKTSQPNPEILKTKGIGSPLGDTPSTFQMEKGKSIQITNIITGYQKAQKTAMTPFRQFQSSFDRDCLESTKITIVGYSFNDEHINESIKIGLRYNKKLLIEIIDPAFIKNEMDLTFSKNIFPFVESDKMNQTKIKDNEFEYYDGKIKVFTLTYKEYLNLKC